MIIVPSYILSKILIFSTINFELRAFQLVINVMTIAIIEVNRKQLAMLAIVTAITSVLSLSS